MIVRLTGEKQPPPPPVWDEEEEEEVEEDPTVPIGEETNNGETQKEEKPADQDN